MLVLCNIAELLFPQLLFINNVINNDTFHIFYPFPVTFSVVDQTLET